MNTLGQMHAQKNPAMLQFLPLLVLADTRLFRMGFSPDIERQLSFKPRPGTKLFHSISPLSMTRRDLAPYWEERDNLPLPPEWQKLPFDDPKVIRSFTRFVLRSVDLFKHAGKSWRLAFQKPFRR